MKLKKRTNEGCSVWRIYIFTSARAIALLRYCDHALSVVCLSSVCRLLAFLQMVSHFIMESARGLIFGL